MISDSTSSGAAARQPVFIWINGTSAVQDPESSVHSSALVLEARPIQAPMSNTSRIAAITATGFESAKRVRFTQGSGHRMIFLVL